MRFLKWTFILFLLLCLTLLALGFGLFYYKPQKSDVLKNLVSHYFIKNKKHPIVHIKENIESKKEEHPKPKVISYNSDVYDAICDLPNTKYDSFGEFKNCLSCPSYLDTSSKGTFNFNYIFLGSFSMAKKNEALVFMSGCNDSEKTKDTIILLEKQGDSWLRSAFFNAMAYSNKPVTLKNKEQEDFLVGLVETKDARKTIQKIRINSFFHKDHKAYDLLKVYHADKQDCSYSLQGAFYPPKAKNGTLLNLGIEVINIDYDIKNKKNCPKKSYSMPPGHYTFEYETSLKDNLKPIGKTKKLLTLFEESFRF